MQNFRREDVSPFFIRKAGHLSFRINIRQKARGLADKLSSRKTATCTLSVAMAAVTFWTFILSGMGEEAQPASVLESLQAAGDVLTASADPNKFTGRSAKKRSINSTMSASILAGTLLDTAGESTSRVRELAQELADNYLAEELETGADITKDVSKMMAEEKNKGQKKSQVIPPAEINRTIEKEINVVEEEQIIEYPVEQRLTSLLQPGQERVMQAGADGAKKVVYQQELVDGEILDEKIVSETVQQEPVNEIRLVGAKGQQAAISPLDFGIELDADGVPVSYSRALTNQVATGYNAGDGAWGASGQTLSAGYVAVHPGEIPYGTRMYITSPDNSFVYGFAIAADTGVGLLGDVIDVDLYYDTYLESCLNGRRNVTIYILD